MTSSEPEQGWLDLEAKFEKGEIVQGRMVTHTQGGLIVEVEGIRGLVPLSQISDLPELRRSGRGDDVARNLRGMHGRMLSLYIIAINWRRNRLILSQRRATNPPPTRILVEPEAPPGSAGVHARLPRRPIAPTDHAMADPDVPIEPDEIGR